MKKYYLDIEFCSPVNLISDISFVSGDVKSSTLHFEFYNKGKRVDISGYTLSIKAKRADGVVIASGGTIKENTAVFTPESNIYSVPGKLQIEVALTNASGMYATTKIITASVIKGFGEAAIEGADNPSVFVKLLSETISAKEAAEAAAQTAAETAKELEGNRTHYTETVLLCDYTHTVDVETWDGSDYGGTFTLDKEIDVDNFRLYINGEYVPVKYRTEEDIYYSFYISTEEDDIFTYNKSDNSIVFFAWISKDNYQLYEETVYQLDEMYIPSSIARTEYVDAFVLKGNVSGSFISLNDVSSVEHAVECKVSGDGITPESVAVQVYGKNLIPYPFPRFSVSSDSITVEDLGDGGLLINGTTTTDTYIYLGYNPSTVYIEGTANGFTANRYNNKIFTSANQGVCYVVIVAGTTCDNIIFYPQIEVGSKYTEFKKGIPYKSLTPNADGTVDGITSVSPCMNIFCKTAGVTLDVTYNRDINKVIENLTNTIISLGGNV